MCWLWLPGTWRGGHGFRVQGCRPSVRHAQMPLSARRRAGTRTGAQTSGSSPMKPTSQSCSLTLGMDTCYPAPPRPAVLPSLESWWHPSPDPAVQGHTRSRGMPSGDHACGPHSAASWGLHGAQGPLPPFPLPSQPPLLLEPPLPHSSPYFWSPTPTPKPDPSTLPNAAPH